MRRFILFLALTGCAVSLPAQQSAAPQTARQALIEMFFSKTPGTFVKHLPELTRAELEKAGTLAGMEQYSTFLSKIHSDDTTLQTYNTGSVLLSSKNSKTLEEFEVRVEKESFRDSQDEIEVSFHAMKNGKEEPMPVRPRMAFSMKQEAQIWKLNEISFTLRVPLADPGLLKAITEKMKAQPSAHFTLAAQNGNPAQSPTPAQSAASDSLVTSAMKTILTAEVAYAVTYPNVGFTCTLSDLDGFGGGEPNEHQAMLINSGLASGKKYGYVLSLSECKGRPATSFRLTAVPNANNLGSESVLRRSVRGNSILG